MSRFGSGLVGVAMGMYSGGASFRISVGISGSLAEVFCCIPWYVQARQNSASSRLQADLSKYFMVCHLLFIILLGGMYSGVSFCDSSFYDDSLLRPLLSRTKY
jgi:hypothetical protein